METVINTQEDRTIVRFNGRLDTPTAQEVAKELAFLEEQADKTIVLDCSELSYISSSGLRIFLSLRKAATAQGGTVIVKGINQDIRNVFMITGFLNLFQIEE